MTTLAALWLLGTSAFLSATLLPGSSEAVLIGLLAAGHGTQVQLVAAATLGNVMGAAVNWLVGRFLARCEGRGWFPASVEACDRAQRWFGRYGVWSLLLSWVPVVGDPLTLAAGLLRVGFLRFLILVATGKLLRYVLLVALWRQAAG